MNHDDYATFEMAQALKSAGFDYPCYELWDFNFADDHSPVKVRRLKDAPRTTVMRCTNSELESYGVKAISAPTLAIAQKWLREVHELSVEPACTTACLWNVNVCNADNMLSETIWSNIGYESYELALAAGISAALELIKNDNKQQQPDTAAEKGMASLDRGTATPQTESEPTHNSHSPGGSARDAQEASVAREREPAAVGSANKTKQP